MDDDQARPTDDASELAAGDDAARESPAAADVAFARLRAADPAGTGAPDLTSVLASVTASTGVPVTEETILVDELSARRARRTPRWLQVAAVVAGIAVIGGGGYALGGAGAGAPPAAGPSAAPAMNLAGGSGASDSAAVAPEAAKNASGVAGSDAKIAGWGFGRTVFAAKGLSTAGGSAAAYGFDAAGTYSQATAERAAAALGVSGTAHQQYGTWTVGPNDGSAPSVSVSSDGLTSLSYSDPTRDPWTCLKTGIVPIQPPTPDAGSTDAVAPAGPAAVAPAPDACRTSTDPAPSADDAVAQAKQAMSALGVDPAGFEFEPSTDSPDAPVTSVSAYQVVDGQRSGVGWNFTVVASGIQSLYGSLAPTVRLGDYHVVSPTDAVARLTDPRFGPTYGGVMPLAADARAGAGGVASSEAVPPAPSDEPTVPATPAAGSPLAWPVEHVTIVSARLGLALTTLPDGASVLVPTYELADADGSTWTVIAVADSDLDFAG